MKKKIFNCLILFFVCQYGIAQEDSVRQRVFLIGDAGELIGGTNEVIEWLKKNVNWDDEKNWFQKKTPSSEQIKSLLAERLEARVRKDYAAADAVRKRLWENYKVVIEDGPGGIQEWRFATIFSAVGRAQGKGSFLGVSEPIKQHDPK